MTPWESAMRWKLGRPQSREYFMLLWLLTGNPNDYYMMGKAMRKKQKRKKTSVGKIAKAAKNAVMLIRDHPPSPEILDLVRDKDVDPAKLKALLDLKASERMAAAQTAYANSMADVQMAIEPVRKDCENRQTQSKYASYTA